MSFYIKYVQETRYKISIYEVVSTETHQMHLFWEVRGSRGERGGERTDKEFAAAMDEATIVDGAAGSAGAAAAAAAAVVVYIVNNARIIVISSVCFVFLF